MRASPRRIRFERVAARVEGCWVHDGERLEEVDTSRDWSALAGASFVWLALGIPSNPHLGTFVDWSAAQPPLRRLGRWRDDDSYWPLRDLEMPEGVPPGRGHPGYAVSVEWYTDDEGHLVAVELRPCRLAADRELLVSLHLPPERHVVGDEEPEWKGGVSFGTELDGDGAKAAYTAALFSAIGLSIVADQVLTRLRTIEEQTLGAAPAREPGLPAALLRVGRLVHALERHRARLGGLLAPQVPPDDHLWQALENVRSGVAAAREEVRSTTEILATVVSIEQQAASERLQSTLTYLTGLVLVPTLVAGVYGANVWVPDEGDVDGFVAMLFMMAGAGAAGFGILRARVRAVALAAAAALALAGLTVHLVF